MLIEKSFELIARRPFRILILRTGILTRFIFIVWQQLGGKARITVEKSPWHKVSGNGDGRKEATPMTKSNSRRKRCRAQFLTLPELDQSKTAVLNSLGSLQSRRSY